MKSLKKTFSYLFMLTALVISFASCSNDDEDNTPKVSSITGDYSGYTSTTMAYTSTPMVYADEKVNIAENSDGTVNVTLTSTVWGTTTISNAKAVVSGSTFAISGSGKTAVAAHGGTSTNEYDCTLEGTVSADKKTVNLVFSAAFMGTTVITFNLGEPDAAKLLQSSYSGYCKMVMKYMPNGVYYDDQTMTLTANEDGTINLTYEFTTESDGVTTTMGSISLENVAVTKDGDNYTFSTSGTFNMGMSGTLSPYDCEVTGTISRDKSTYSIEFSLPSVMGGTTVTFINGSAPEA